MRAEPTPEQLHALEVYAVAHGKCWKRHLLNDWLNGKDATFHNGHLLRQVRNQFGPRWLESFNFEDKG